MELNPKNESFAERLKRDEMEELMYQQQREVYNQQLKCSEWKAEKEKASENLDEHKKSVDLFIEASKEYRMKAELSLQKIESDIECVKAEITKLRNRKFAYELGSQSSGLDLPCPDTTGWSSWLNPCLDVQRIILAVVVATFIGVLIILIWK